MGRLSLSASEPLEWGADADSSRVADVSREAGSINSSPYLTRGTPRPVARDRDTDRPPSAAAPGGTASVGPTVGLGRRPPGPSERVRQAPALEREGHRGRP